MRRERTVWVERRAPLADLATVTGSPVVRMSSLGAGELRTEDAFGVVPHDFEVEAILARPRAEDRQPGGVVRHDELEHKLGLDPRLVSVGPRRGQVVVALELLPETAQLIGHLAGLAGDERVVVAELRSDRVGGGDPR